MCTSSEDFIAVEPPVWANPPTKIKSKAKKQKEKGDNMAKATEKVDQFEELTKDEQLVLKKYREGALTPDTMSKEDTGNLLNIERKTETLKNQVLRLSIDIVNAEKQRNAFVDQMNDILNVQEAFNAKLEAKYGLYGKKWNVDFKTGKIQIEG